MKIAIDKYSIDKIKDFKDKECIYVFGDEPLDELLKLNLHCVHRDYIDTIQDIEYPFIKNHKFAIIVPNYNNDHRRL